MGLGARLKERSFHLTGKAVPEPPRSWEQGCRGWGPRGQCWGPRLEQAAGPQAVPGPTQAPFSCQRRERMQRGDEIPCFNAPKPHLLSVNQQETSWWGKQPLQSPSSGGRWDTEGHGVRRAMVVGSPAPCWGRRLCPLPEAACRCVFVGSQAE